MCKRGARLKHPSDQRGGPNSKTKFSPRPKERTLDRVAMQCWLLLRSSSRERPAHKSALWARLQACLPEAARFAAQAAARCCFLERASASAGGFGGKGLSGGLGFFGGPASLLLWPMASTSFKKDNRTAGLQAG